MSRAKLNMGMVSGRKRMFVATAVAVFLAISAVALIGLRTTEAASPHSIFGYVTYEDGTPVAGALVNITVVNTTNSSDIRGYLENTTDVNGYFTFQLANLPNEWSDGDVILGYAVYDGFGGHNSTTIIAALPGQWFNITINEPKTTKHIGEPSCESGYYVTSHTEFNFTAEPAPNSSLVINATYYRIWYNGTWSNWTIYTGNFTLDQGEGLYYIEFYSDDNESHEEVVHNQSHWVDDTPPLYSDPVFGFPNSTINGFPAINCETPLWINVSDDYALGDASGVTWINISIWRNPNQPGPYNKIFEINITDNSTYDLNPEPGVISVDVNQFIDEECYHEIIWKFGDCVGNTNGPFDIDISVDCSKPIISKEIGQPQQPGIYGNATWITSRTPIWFNVTDVGCGGGAGVWKFGYSVRWKENASNASEPWNETKYEPVVVVDNGPLDLDNTTGVIRYIAYLEDDCVHEIHYWAVDYVGNNNTTKQKHWVDNTPPYIRKDIEKVVMVEQTEMNNASFINISGNENETEDWQSFTATWSYIDAVSVHICGTIDTTYPPTIQIWNSNRSQMLAETEPLNISEYNETGYFYCGWIQLHLPERLYVEHGETYWLHISYESGVKVVWNASTNNPYAGGYAIVNNETNMSWDFTFKIEYYPLVIRNEVGETVFFEGFEDDWVNDSDDDLAPPGWEVIVTNNDTNGYPCYWLQYNDSMWPGGLVYGGNYSAGLWWNWTNQSEWLISPEIDLPNYAKLNFWSIYIRPEVANPDVHNYVLISTDNGTTWTVLADLMHNPKYEAGGNVIGEELFNWYEEPVEISLYNYGGEKVRLAWYYEVIGAPDNDDGVWGIWVIDNVTVETVNVSFVYDPDTLYTFYNDTISYDGLDETWVTSEAIFDLSSDDEGCMGGVGFQSLMYRIWFNNTWHPVDGNDVYCGNYNITNINGTYWYVALNETVDHTKIQFHEECEHILQIRAEDKLGNVRIINQTHYVDNSPPVLRVEYPDVHGFYYDEETGKQYVRAGKTFYLNLTDEPECAVGWKNFTFYWRYEYTNFTTPYIEEHPTNGSDHEYEGDLVYIDGHWWWKVTPGEPSVALRFDRECMHTIYYFYEATDWLDNEINTSDNVSEVVVYVDENGPEMNKEHPPCYTDEPVIYLHPNNWPERENPWTIPEWEEWVIYLNWTQLYPADEFGRVYESTNNGKFGYYYDMDGNDIADDGDYIELVDTEYGVHRLYLIENLTMTLEIYNETLNETKYVEFMGWWNGTWPSNSNFSQIVDEVGTIWKEIYPNFGEEYNLTFWFIDLITLNNTATGEETNWTILNATWDLIVDPVPFIQKCSRINLTAWDTPEILKLVDQFQNVGDRADELQLRDNILQWPWDAQPFQVSENVTAINEVWLWLDWDGPANVTIYLHDDSPFTPGNELGSKTVYLTGTSTGEWVKFVFDPPISVTPGQTYMIDAFRENGSLVHWYHADSDVYIYGAPYISSEQSTGDWMFAIVAYRPNPCASGIEGIYYGYEYNGTFHPTSMTDNVSTYGQVINISQYYSDEEIETNFSGHYLWYVYDDSIGVHFHEECIHWLYYWAKDNVCHHTPVHMQVYHVDEYIPVVEKEHPSHGYYTPVEISVDSTFENYTTWLEGEFHVRDEWYPGYSDGWIADPDGQYVYKRQEITFTITNNDLNHDLHLILHVEEVEGDEGITLVNGSDVNEKTYDIMVPAGSSLDYTVTVYDYKEFLRWGIWYWWAEVENVTQYLRMGARINLSAYDPGYCAAGIENIYYRYEWNGSTYPIEGHPAAVNGSEIEPGVPEIANYWWYVYDNTTGIVFNEECKHDLYYFAKDRACHNSTIHHQVYYVDGSAPVIDEELPDHGAIGNATVSLEEGFYVPMDNGWAIVNGSDSYWDLKSNEPYGSGMSHDTYADYSGEYYAMAWRDDSGSTSADAWLITPKVTIPEDGNLTFYYATYYSSGNEAAFEVCVNNVSTQTDTAAFVPIWDSGNFGDTTYRKVEIDLHEYAGQEIYIGFHCYYLESYYPYGGLTIDDVWIGGIHRVAKLLDDDVESGMDGWTIDDLTVDGSYWRTVERLPVGVPPNPGWNTSMPNKPALWCGDLSLGNANNGGGMYGHNWNDTITIKQPLNLSNVTGPINLTFWMWYYALAPYDYLYVEVSNDSENWTVLKDLADNDAIYTAACGGWAEYTLNMTPYIGNDTVWIRFRFVSSDVYTTEYNGFFIDNLTVSNETMEFFNDTFDDLSKWNAVMLETSRWHIVDSDYHSTNHSWWDGEDGSGEYLNFMDDVLISPVLDLNGYSYEYITLTFWHKRDFSDNDYGRVEYRYSYDGTTWTTWHSFTTYYSHRDWVQEFLTLSIHPQKIQYRFHFVSNTGGTDNGWFIDDIRVELRNITTTAFEDDFERYTGILPLQGDVSHDFGWTVDGNFEQYYNYRYGWSHHQMPEYTLAMIHAGWSYNQDEWLISPVIHNLPKFSNLTFSHWFTRTATSVQAYVYIKVDNGTWEVLKVLSPDSGFTTEDISLWPYYGHDIQIAFRFVSPFDSSFSSSTNFWAIEWVKITSFGFLRAGAVIHLDATDLPDSECKVGVSNIYYRYVWENTSYPEGYEPYHGTNWVWGWEIPGISNETDPDIGPYAWYIYNDAWGIKFNDECVHDLYYFAKDWVCHSSELHHERWYVDGTAPETVLGISWGNHPWIPRNDDGKIRVAIFNSDEYPDYIDPYSGIGNIYSNVKDILENDPEDRFDVSVITTLDYSTIRDFDVLVLPDNVVPSKWLDDVDAWFIEGRRIVAIDSAICTIAYEGYLWEDSKGSHGYGIFWDYENWWDDDQRIVADHPITKDYHVGQIITSVSGDAQMYKDMLPSDAVILTESVYNDTAYAVYRQLPEPGRGSIVVLGPFDTLDSYYSDQFGLVREACAYNMSHQYPPSYGYDERPDVICINDDVHLGAVHYGKAPCIYPYNHTNATYYRWTWWNPETEELEYYPNASTPGAVWGGDITVSSHADEIEDYWWMPYTGPFYFTEACNHTLYYFSKDDLCNTEGPNEWYVGVDDAAPETELEFDIPDGTCLWYDAINDTYYFQDGTLVGINATDMPNNTYCRTGVWKMEYTVWKWNSTQAEVTILSDDLTYYATLYIHGDAVGEIWDYIDVDNDSKFSVGDYIYIDWNSGMSYNDGWYRIADKTFNGMFVLTVEDIFSGAGDWEVLIPWTTVYSDGTYSDYDGNVYREVGYNYTWMTLWLDVGGLNHYFHPEDDNNCGKYEIHWRVYDYNNMTIGERKQDVDIDCTPPRTTKEFGEPVIEQQISGGETVHWVNPATTKIWLNGTDDFLWDSGVAETWYKFWEEEPILLWKLNNETYNKHWFTIDEAAQALGYEDAADYFAHSPNVAEAKGKIELYHWSKDRVCHVEDWNESKQHIYVDGLPPVSRVADIEPYQQEEVPFNITVVDIMDYGFEAVGPIGVCKVEVYYAYSENNVTYGDWQLYTTYNVPWDERNDVPNWTFSFTAPDGSGWYRFKSIAYDCLGNVELPPFYHGDYDAECYVLGDTEPPVVTKEYGQPSVEIDLGEEMGHAITSDTPIYINATDMPSDDYVGIDKIYWSFDGITWHETASYGGAHEAHHSFTPSAFGLAEETIYHIFFKATDMLGHVSEEGKQKFIIDDTAPVTTITIGDNATMPFDVTVNATDNVVGVDTITLYFRYSSDGSTWSEWMEYGSATGNYTWSFIYNPDDGYYKPGYYQFYVYAEDKLGNAKSMPDETTTAEASCYVPPIAEDINGDGRVNVMDLYQIITHWGETGTPGWIPEDLNNDGVIDAEDIYALILKWTG